MPTTPQTPPPAYFLSLSLENVRSFGEKQTISFARPDGRPAQWTIILGDNGVGKTTVLKALAAIGPVANPNWEGTYGTLYFDSWNYKWEPTRDEVKTTKIDFNIGTGLHLDKMTKTHFKPFKTYGNLIIDWDEGIPGKQEGINISDMTGFFCLGYGAGRTIGSSTLGRKFTSKEEFASLFDDRADLLNPEEWFLQMEYSSLKKDKQAGKALEQVRQVLLQVLPDITDIRISSKGHQQFLELESPYGWVRLREMSLGYQTLVVWLTDFASKLFLRYPDSPNPLEEPAIVLIDEIDLHLHPSWQRKLLGFLSGIFKNTQFIATAHSPLVVQAAGDEGANVVLLRREGDQTVVVTDVEDVRGWRVDQILTSSFYNLETARSLETEKKLERQAALLNKKKLTAKDRQELDALTLELEGQPMGSAGAEAEEEALLRQIAERLGTGTDK
ncbi:hypothetical protein D0T11_17060 [Hymenobacter rubripertinctus]|uniref:ATPase AAA-type core domain-containing protein n=2 Tax=Hymenobacter rubripertinctus TaxID=2029981 RepID=A0A418QQD1_9BACT|nr:hypothetical protein D0T11_17060 [Hymenobacter rubripertinctus]